MLHVPVQKIKVRSTTVKIGVDVILLRSRSQLSIVKQIHHPRRTRHRAKSNRAIIFARLIDMLVHAIVKQIVPVAPPWI